MMKSSRNGEVWPLHQAVSTNNLEEVKRLIVAALQLTKSPVNWGHPSVVGGFKLHRRWHIRGFAVNLRTLFLLISCLAYLSSCTVTPEIYVSSGIHMMVTQSANDVRSNFAFQNDGTFVTASKDGILWKWDVNGAMVYTRKIYDGALPSYSVTFSPKGKFFAEINSDKVLIKSTDTGSQIREINTEHRGSNKAVTFSYDEKHVLSDSSGGTLKLWDVATGEVVKSFSGQDDVWTVALSSDGRLALSGGADKTVKLWDIATGKEVVSFHHGEPVSKVSFSEDGKFAFSSSPANHIKVWDIASKKQMYTFKGSFFAVSPDSHYIITSTFINLTTAELTLYDLKTGKEVKRLRGSNNQLWEIAFSPDGRHIVVADWDASIRIYDYLLGEEVATFIGFKDKEWMSIITGGYYNASIKATNYLRIKKGDKEYGLNSFYDVFFRPDIVAAKLKGDDITNLITITMKDAVKLPPPNVELKPVQNDIKQSSTKCCYEIRSTGGGIGEVRVFHNGKLIKSDGYYRENLAKLQAEPMKLAYVNSRAIYEQIRGLALKEKQDFTSSSSKSKGDMYKDCIEIEPVPGNNEISVAAFNSTNTVQSSLETRSFSSNHRPEEPHLYILAVGIDKYRDSSVNLRYAAKDSKDFIEQLPKQAATIYRPNNIHLTNITDESASKVDIIAAIDELSKRIRPQDSFIFFNASHGVLLQNQYYIVTADFDGDLSSANSLISSNEIVEMSKKIKSLSQLYIFDTCHAGGVDNIISGLYDARMSVLAKKMGLHIFASAGTFQAALDGYMGNGLYTHILLQGIQNGREVDVEKTGKVTVKSLGLYTKEKTTEYSTRLGHPQTPYIINFGNDNPLFIY
ncbi:MAG: caspase family protein [Pseudomonadota bacterium]